MHKNFSIERIVNLHIEKLLEGTDLATWGAVQGLVVQGLTIQETIDIARDIVKKTLLHFYRRPLLACGNMMGTPAARAAFSSPSSAVANSAPLRIATSRYEASYADNLYSRANGKTPLICALIGRAISCNASASSNSTNRRICVYPILFRRSPTSKTLATSNDHIAGTSTGRPSRPSSTRSA